MIPLGTERDGRGPSRAVIGLILANVLARVIFGPGGNPEAWMATWAFSPRDPHWWNLLTYQFAHDPGSWLHLAGNMLFCGSSGVRSRRTSAPSGSCSCT